MSSAVRASAESKPATTDPTRRLRKVRVAPESPMSASAATLAPPAPSSVERKSVTVFVFIVVCFSNARYTKRRKRKRRCDNKIMAQLRAQGVPPYNDYQSRTEEAIAAPAIASAEAAAVSAHTARGFVACTRARSENVSVSVFEVRLFFTSPYQTIQFLEHRPSQRYITNTVFATRS